MLESKFLFVGKILFLAYLIINIPVFFPVKFFDTSYYFIITTTLLDTATLLVLSLSISKYIYIKNLKLLSNLSIKEANKDEFINKIEILKRQILNNSRFSFVFASLFLIITLIQPIVLISNLYKSEIYSSSVIESISAEFKNQEEIIKDLILKNNLNKIDDKNIKNLKKDITNLSNLKEKRINQFLKQNNIKKFDNIKIIIRNIILSLLWALVFYKIYKI